ncbi:MAG: hypothetical protein WCJ95_13215 [Mariniphaga sp.]
MIINLEIKKIILAAAFSLIILIGCQKPIIQELITDPATSNMKLIPSAPTIQDEVKLVIYNDCNYNTLIGITKNGNTIQVVKQFNSLMKRPCFIKNDTINIGKLSQGGYILNYKLLDNATTPPQTTLNLNFNLIVAQ